MALKTVLQRIRVNELIRPLRCVTEFNSKSFHRGRAAMLTSKQELERIEHEKISTLRSDFIFREFELTENERNFRAFNSVLKRYKQQESVYRRGHVEFIYAALAKMPNYGVNKNLDAYKALLSVFPEGVMKATTMWQIESTHYPKQQWCAIDLLEDMERYGVCPDDEVGQMLDAIFGRHVQAFRKYRRMMYWMPKMKHVSPYPLPRPLPSHPADLAVVALKRMAVDLENRVTVHRPESEETDGSRDDFIASAQSPKQRELIARHPVDKPLYVEGAFNVWTGAVGQSYFILSSDARQLPAPATKEETDNLDVKKWTKIFDDEDCMTAVIEAPSVHEMDDRTVLGMCITASSSKDSLVSWIRILQQVNPNLGDTLIVFQLRSQEHGLEVYSGEEKKESGEIKSL